MLCGNLENVLGLWINDAEWKADKGFFYIYFLKP